MQPGDIVFCHSTGWVAGAIRLGERFRSPSQDAYWNHVAVVVEPYPDGWQRIVQATGKGIVYGRLADLPADRVVVPSEWFPTLTGKVDRAEIIAQAHAIVGAKYGWLTIASITANLLTPKWVRFPDFRSGTTFTCSAAVAWCLHAGGADIDTYDIYQIFPSELRSLAFARHEMVAA